MGEIAKFYVMPHPTMIIPELGDGEETKITATTSACEKVADEIGEIKPDTVIVITPHGPLFGNAVAFTNEEKIYGQIKKDDETKVFLNFDINTSLINNITTDLKKENINCVNINSKSCELYGIEYELDYGTIIPMYFIDKKLSDYKIIQITCGEFSKFELYKIGMIIKKAVEESESKAVCIASGELSHRLTEDGPYGYTPEGKNFDVEIQSLLKNGDVLNIYNMDNMKIDAAGTCGMNPLYTMLGVMNGNEVKGNILSYEGPFGIGYAVIDFSLSKTEINMYEQIINEKNKKFQNRLEDETIYAKLARESLTKFLMEGIKIEVPSYVTDEMIQNKAGVMISIMKDRKIVANSGYYLPRADNIAEEIINCAINLTSVNVNQTGFGIKDLEDIDIYVETITDVEKVSIEELNPEEYGVYVRSGMKSGMFFPRIPGVETSEQQLNAALQQGNISSFDDYIIKRFKVTSHY